MSRREGKSDVKTMSSTHSLHLKLFFLRVGEVSGIPGVEVKFVDIGRNICGEGDLLDDY